MTTEKLENMFCSLKTANFIWPALHIWHVFLGWPFRIVEMKCAVFRPRKITGFHCSALLMWHLSINIIIIISNNSNSSSSRCVIATTTTGSHKVYGGLHRGRFTCNEHRFITVYDISIYETGLQRYGLETVV